MNTLMYLILKIESVQTFLNVLERTTENVIFPHFFEESISLGLSSLLNQIPVSVGNKHNVVALVHHKAHSHLHYPEC